MIIGKIAQWDHEKSAFHPIFHKAVEFIRSHEQQNYPLGKFDIDGEDMFAVISELESVLPKERKAECHKKYIDFQYLIDSSQEEIILAAKTSEHNYCIEDQLDEEDYALYDKVAGESEIRLTPGMFAVFFPSDLHRPVCSDPGGVYMKKLVVKINHTLLGS